MVYMEIEFETGAWKISDIVYLEIGHDTKAWKISDMHGIPGNRI